MAVLADGGLLPSCQMLLCRLVSALFYRVVGLVMLRHIYQDVYCIMFNRVWWVMACLVATSRADCECGMACTVCRSASIVSFVAGCVT